jgi:hypothetical protein
VRRKGEFALAVADRLAHALSDGTPVAVPAHLQALFDFLYPGPSASSESGSAAAGVLADRVDDSNGA